MVAKSRRQIDLCGGVHLREGLAQVWADVERFDLDELLAADPAGEPLPQRRSFAV
jgi:hypothetical protein